MLDPIILDALNAQVTHERQNAATYTALANRLDFYNLPGLASFLRHAGSEEQTHADKFTDYLIDRNALPVIAPLDGVTAPDADMLTIGAACFGAALQREILTTEQIRTLYALAEDGDDSQTCQFLWWFLDEQTKSEREYTALTARLQFATGCAAAVLQIDHELGA